MNLKEIVSKILGLEQSISALTTAGANSKVETISALAGELTSLKATTVSELEKANSNTALADQKLSASNASLEKANADALAVNAALKTACGEMKLEIKEGANSIEMVSAIKDGVATTLAKLNIDPAKLPAAPAKQGANNQKTASRKEFDAMSHDQRNAFFKSGGKLVE